VLSPGHPQGLRFYDPARKELDRDLRELYHDPMEKKKTYQPGDMVTTFTGQAGVVIPADDLSRVRDLYKEGKKPGHFFAPGCCHHPDYITQIPVLFEDATYDVMRAMNIRKATGVPEETRLRIQALLEKG
jgi:hypothetical protein